jgi:hypothetical protein
MNKHAQIVEKLNLYTQREKMQVDTASLLYPKYQLRSKEADLHALQHFPTTIQLFNKVENNRTRKGNVEQHKSEIIKVQYTDDVRTFLNKNGIKNIVESYSEEWYETSNGRYEIYEPLTHCNALTYQVIYDKMHAVYNVYEPFKMKTYGGTFTKWCKLLKENGHIKFDNIAWRCDGIVWCYYDKLQKEKFKENRVQWYTLEELLKQI